jgi:cobalamin biosynthesis Mg chelatase CobN
MERGIAAAQAGDKTTAHRIFQSIAVRHADIPDIWVWVGGTSPTLDEAEAAFERASMLDPNNEEARLGLRWASLRRQATGAPARSTGPMSTDYLTSPNFDSGAFSTGSTNSGNLAAGGPQPSVPFGPAQPAPAAYEAPAEAPAETPVPVAAKRGGLSVAAIIMILAVIVLTGVFFWLMYMQ